MDRVRIHREMVELEHIELFLRDTRTDGPAILCLHGRWGRGETWVDFIEQYGVQYRVIAPDLRGHGLSGKPLARYTAEEMAWDMVCLLDYLKLKPVIVVGHSMGGHVAGYLAAEYLQYVRAAAILDKSANGPQRPSLLPVEQLDAIDPVTHDWPLPFQSLREAQEFLKKTNESDLSYRYFMNSLVETVDGYTMMFSEQAMAAGIACYENWYHLLPKIECPVMLARSSSHEAVPDAEFQMMQSLLANCLVFEVSHPDHNIHLGNQSEFYRYFDEFLRSI